MGVQVMSNPALTSFKGLDALQQLGGGLLVVNNTALTSLDGLGALGALNATGAASVSLPKVCSLLLQVACSAPGAALRARVPAVPACLHVFPTIGHLRSAARRAHKPG